jgi:hypothetical protein
MRGFLNVPNNYRPVIDDQPVCRIEDELRRQREAERFTEQWAIDNAHLIEEVR